MALADDEKANDIERMEGIIKVGLGKEAFEYIESLDLSMPNYNLIINAIMAAIGDVSIEEVEEESKKAKKKPRK